MNVVVLIDGREAIPVRALPLVAPLTIGVRKLVEGLMRSDRLNEMYGLTAHQLLPGEPPLKIPPPQWKRSYIRLLGLKASLKREESAGRVSDDEGCDKWSTESISILPAGVFVWKDAFVDAHTRNFRRLSEEEIVALQNSGCDHDRFLQQILKLPANDPVLDHWEYMLGKNWREQLAAYIAERMAIEPIPPESIALNDRNFGGQAPLTDVSFAPLVEPDLCKLVMEGFEHLLPVASGTSERAEPVAPLPDVEQLQTELPTTSETVKQQSEQEHATDAVLPDDEIAALFDPVKAAQLEAMFPDGGKWAKYAERAKRNGLKSAARTSRGMFNPYRAAIWWLATGPAGWKWERCLRVLANNLPARSIDSKHLLTGEYE